MSPISALRRKSSGTISDLCRDLETSQQICLRYRTAHTHGLAEFLDETGQGVLGFRELEKETKSSSQLTDSASRTQDSGNARTATGSDNRDNGSERRKVGDENNVSAKHAEKKLDGMTDDSTETLHPTEPSVLSVASSDVRACSLEMQLTASSVFKCKLPSFEGLLACAKRRFSLNVSFFLLPAHLDTSCDNHKSVGSPIRMGRMIHLPVLNVISQVESP
eukprot:g47652.t1